MLYAIFGEDHQGSLPGRLQQRTAHLARVTALRDRGRLVVAGPHPLLDTREPGEAGYSGSLIIAEFADLADAETWAADDPYLHAGVWTQVTVKPFVQVLP